jgi:hypothetical protein
MGPLVTFDVLLLVVLFLIVDHARAIPGRGLALFHLEAFSLWAAYAFGWSLFNHGFRWRDNVEDALGGWVASAVAGLLLIAIVRRFSRKPNKP